MNKIDNFNRSAIIERYVDDIVGNMHFLEVKEQLKDLLLEKKHNMSSNDLEIEITRHDPRLLRDVYIEEMMEELYHV